MSKRTFSKCLGAMIACVFLLHCSQAKLSAQDWSIRQLKNHQHPILETTGQQFDFRDEVLGHVVAELETEFIDDQLHLSIFARSARIGGYRSYRHVHGSNRLTARALRKMVDGVSALQLRDQTGRLIPATLKPTEQKLPERRLNLDGSMNYLAMTQQEFTVQLEVVSEVLPRGSYQIDLFVEKQLRLQVKFQVNEKLQAVSFHSALHFVSQQRSESEKTVAPQAELEKPADWEQRDFEGKYFLLSQAIKRDEKDLPRWVDFLFEQKDYRLLEQLVLTQAGGFDCHEIGARLANLSAPNWPRLAYWAISYRREHTNVSVAAAIDEHKDAYYSWCLLNQIAIPENVEYAKQDASQYLATLDSEEVFAALKPPAEVTKFTGKKAVEGEFYLQQFERAVLTTVNWITIYQHREEELLQLLKHPNNDIRKEVLLAYTHLEPNIVPYLKLFQIANEQSEVDSVREMATLAATYGPRNKVLDRINAIANQMEHPGWKPAVSRLGDIGSGYDLNVLQGSNPEGEKRQEIMQRSIKLIAEREAALLKIWRSNEHGRQSSHANTRLRDARRKMDRLVEARLQNTASVEALHQWTSQYFKKAAKPSVVSRTLGQLITPQKEGAYADQLKACVNKIWEEMAQ